MKRSAMVSLVVSGALVAACNRTPVMTSDGFVSDVVLTNNTYQPGYGYWHAPFHAWYPYPYNFYRPGFGYFAGGNYWSTPHYSTIIWSSPRFDDPALRGGVYRGSGTSFFHSGSSGTSIQRGGFGHSGRLGGG